MHPVGPLNSKVYWIRRVSIVVLAVAVLVGMVWFLASRTSRSSASQEQAAAVVNTSAAPTLTGVLAASSGATRSTIPTASPTPTGSSIAAPTASVPVSSGAPVSDPAAVDPAAAAAAEAAAAAAAATPTPPPADPAAEAAAAAAAQAAAAQAAADAAAAASSAAAAAVPPSYDAQGKLLCPDAAVAVVAISTAPSFAVGSNPTLGMTVTNTGTEACQRDVSGTLQSLTVLAADGSRVWSTGDCFPGEGTEVRELTPGQSVKYTIKWSGTTSAPGCTGDRAAVPAGDYTVVAQLGSLVSAPAAFAITG